MKLKMILSAVLLAGVFSAHAVSAGGTNAAAPVDSMTALFGDPAIVKGNGFEIKRSELDSLMSAAKSQATASGQQLPPGFDIYMLDQLITMQVLVQKATPADRIKGKADADLQFSNIMARVDSPEDFQRKLKLAGTTEDELRAKATQEATAKAALKRELNVQITDAAVQDYYSNHTSEFEVPELAHVRHILLMTVDPAARVPLSTNAVAAKRKLIEDIQKRAAGGQDFAALAKQYSEDPGTKDNGGELQPFPRDSEQLPTEFESAAFSLKPGQVSDVITTMYGFHVIKSIERVPAKKYGLTDNIPQFNMTAAGACKAELESEQIRQQLPAYVQKLRTEYDVQILDPNLKAMEESMLAAATNAPAGGMNQ